MKRTILLSLLLATIGVRANIDRAELIVHFASDVSSLDQRAIDDLVAFLARVDLGSDHAFLVQGHTDHAGGTAYNDALGLARARSVQAFLCSHGVGSSSIEVEGYGERSPLRHERTEDDMALDRRVRVTFERYRYSDLAEFNEILAGGAKQRFDIDPNKQQYLRCTNGITVLLQPSSLVDGQGRPLQDPATVTITEANQLAAMLAHGLSTVSNGRLLETSGMLKVEANSMDGTSLTLDPTKPMMVSIPASTTGAGMQLFLSPSGTNWSATGQAAQVSAGDVRYALPPYPSYNSPRFEAPCYKPTTKFHAPPDPVLPSEPVLPDRVDYVREPKWFEFLWAGRVSQQNEKRYANALRNFEHAREKYHDRWEDYQRDCSSMADRLSEWKRKEDRRQHALVQDSLRWRSEVYDVAFAKHQRECAAYDRAYQQRVRAYERRCDELKGEWAQRLDSLGLASGTDLGRYVFSVSGMGWVNCDRFIDVAADQRFTAVVPDRERSTDNVYVIFNDINSILPMHLRAAGDLVCEGIPTGLRATVLALRVQDEKVMMSLRPLEQRGPCALDFKPSSFLEVQQTLQRLRNERG